MLLLLLATVERAILRMLMAAYAIAADFAENHGHEKDQVPFVLGKVEEIQRRVWSVTW